jgi:tetratricopeptide (TPR) repeat protein
VKKCATAFGVLALSTLGTAALAADKLEPDDLPPPQPEVVSNPPAVDTPAVPGFELPAMPPGLHGPRELRVRGKSLLGTDIKIAGYVTWVSDCPAQLATANPTATRAQILAAIDNDPTVCPPPKFYLGDAKTTPQDASLWVVDLPRPPSKKEREQLAKDKKPLPVLPKVAVGDFVVAAGSWATKSSRGELNTNGLLLFRSVERAAPPAAAAPATAAPAAPAEPEVVVAKPPIRPKVTQVVRNKSAGHLNACIKGIAQRMYDPAITECEAATKAWDGNHLAWYTLASAHMAKSEWPEAVAAVEHAVTQRPDQGMYQLYHGISLYEAAHRSPDQAGKDPKAGTAAAPNNLDGARDALRRAIKLAPDLWRAHYYLGRIYRERDDARGAAEQFTATIKTHPTYRFAYIALIELYRRWDYLDQALALGQLGTTNVPAPEAWELWFELGMIYDAKRAPDQAIDAFGKAIAGKPDDFTSKFQRGQLYFRKGDYANARRDLDEVMKSTDPGIASVKPVAQQMLTQMASKPH